MISAGLRPALHEAASLLPSTSHTSGQHTADLRTTTTGVRRAVLKLERARFATATGIGLLTEAEAGRRWTDSFGASERTWRYACCGVLDIKHGGRGDACRCDLTQKLWRCDLTQKLAALLWCGCLHYSDRGGARGTAAFTSRLDGWLWATATAAAAATACIL